MAGLVTGGLVDLECDIPEGRQHERLHVFDLALPAGVVPRNIDGEVAEHRLMPVDEALARAAAGELTTDAALATLDFAVRHRLVEPTSRDAGIHRSDADAGAMAGVRGAAPPRTRGRRKALSRRSYHSKQLKCGVNRAQPGRFGNAGTLALTMQRRIQRKQPPRHEPARHPLYRHRHRPALADGAGDRRQLLPRAGTCRTCRSR